MPTLHSKLAPIDNRAKEQALERRIFVLEARIKTALADAEAAQTRIFKENQLRLEALWAKVEMLQKALEPFAHEGAKRLNAAGTTPIGGWSVTNPDLLRAKRAYDTSKDT